MTGNVINRRNARFLRIYIYTHTSISPPMNLSTWQTLPINSISISSRERETHPPRGKHLSLPSSSSVPSFPRKEFTRSCRISPDSAEGRKELLTRPREPVKLPWSVAETRPNGMPRSPIPVPMKVRHRRFSSSPFHSFNPFSPRYFLFKEEFSSRILLAFFFKNIYRIKG